MFSCNVFQRINFLRTRKYYKIKRTFSTSCEGPLKDCRILDLTRIVAGPYCTMILADLGAEVIKVEKPGSGDETRKWGPPFVTGSRETCYFVGLNRNKKSICLDLKTKEGRNVILDLSKECDVLIENYVPGKLDALGLGYDNIKKIAPHLIYCSLTGYGSKGPYKNKPGYDVIAASIGGLMSITGPRNGPPCKVGVAMTDIATGLYAHGAILAALLYRMKTGKGQRIDCNLLSTQVSCLINIGSNYLNANEDGLKWGNSHVSIVPYRAYETLDDQFITIGAGSDAQFSELCKKLQIHKVAFDDKFMHNQDRVNNRNELDNIIQNELKKRTLSDWLMAFEGSSFPFGPVNKISQVFDDDHIRNIDLVKEVHHPVAGKLKLVGPPVEFSECKNVINSPPPLLGEHTNDVLRNILNYSSEKVEKLKKLGVI